MPTYPDCSYVSVDDTDEPTGASYIYCLAAEVRKLKRAAADANDLVASFPIMAPFTACDPYWDNVVLAMHMDSEVSDIKGHATMVYGSAAIVTDVDMVGGKAGSFNGSSRIVVADSDDFTLTGDFGIELQAKATDGTAYRSVLSSITLNADSWANGVEIFTKDGVWKATLYDSGASPTTVIGPAATTAKQHVSLCRVGSTVTLYVDGVGGTGVTWANTLNAKGITIGNAWDTATRGWVGKVNQVIMYKNTSPRTADFTTPTEPFYEVACL